MKFVFIALLTALVSTMIEFLARKARPKSLTESGGRISPSRVFMWFTLTFALLLTWLWVEMLVSKEDVLWALLLGALCLNFTFAALLGLFNIHDVTWNEDYVEGPSLMIGIVLGWKRERVKWEQIEAYGSNWAEYIYVEGANRKIYWGVWYPGFGMLRETIITKTFETGKV